jgi:hypothetical protein
MSESDLEEPPDNPVSEEIPKKLGARALRAKDNKLLNEFVIKCSSNLFHSGFQIIERVSHVQYYIFK